MFIIESIHWQFQVFSGWIRCTSDAHVFSLNGFFLSFWEILLSNADQQFGQQIKQNTCRPCAHRSCWAISCEFLLSLPLGCLSVKMMVCIGCSPPATKCLLGDRTHLSQWPSRELCFKTADKFILDSYRPGGTQPWVLVWKGGQDTFPRRFCHGSDLQVNIWELACCQPCEQSGRVCPGRTDPCRVPTPLLLSSLCPSLPVLTCLHWAFAHISSWCFSFFSYRWICLHFSWLKVFVLLLLKPSLISSLSSWELYCY